MYKIDRRGGGSGGVQKSFSRNIPKHAYNHMVGWAASVLSPFYFMLLDAMTKP